jgi:uncharacterized protein (DUF4415 family)
MDIAFDPAKDLENIRKHGISLQRAEDFDYDSAVYDVDDREDYGEVRFIRSAGWIHFSTHWSSPKPKLAYVPSACAGQRGRRKQNMATNKNHAATRDDNPEWKNKRFNMRIGDLPESLQAKLRKGRGPQKEPTKVPVSIRLSPDVVERLRNTGAGWQNRVDGALRAWLELSTGE